MYMTKPTERLAYSGVAMALYTMYARTYMYVMMTLILGVVETAMYLEIVVEAFTIWPTLFLGVSMEYRSSSLS